MAIADCSHNIAARQQIRDEYGVQGTILEDYCLLGCRPCSAAQELNQLGVNSDVIESDVRQAVDNMRSSKNTPDTSTHQQAFGQAAAGSSPSTAPATAAAPVQDTMNAA
mmetsp:Transcript_7936/g.8878  ORF Transcript_7936/g.8878 Transcript_7936/m.8878 type:complete len:109 (+) Transcript_7936:1-327(+)